MEAVGLAVGIPSLLSACMDVLERIEAYKEFGVESRHAVAQFEADKLRLKKWANGVGISDGKWKEIHDPRLKNYDLEVAVKRILNCACEIFDAAERTREKAKNNNKAPLPTSIRGGLGWAFRRRGKFKNQVEMFRGVVDTLYNLVPPASDLELRQFQDASNVADRINGILPSLNPVL
ncbi:hypothetical protein K469DRAFT_584627 [Zopfia rhizophila CBS 207.26]|uniref:Prion-inhibition and propagation HeLo domain-containing protein n=1 Tax=Zopfia rhizophila CBS 207.26 TaxID=1314779 RepID=A0A6A6DZA0_9PEZI|nr:hypothetical protein K469DRAFT_584627 [Zopfia rhizophila CBS 207.26]